MGFKFQGLKYFFVAWEYWILGFEAGTAQNLWYIVFLQCRKVHLGAKFEQLEILLAESFDHEGVVTGPWNHEGCEICIILCKILVVHWLSGRMNFWL